MADDFDLLVADAVLPFEGAEGRVSIGVRDGTIAEIGPPPVGTGTRRIDAGGGLVTPPFADPHLHLHKVYTLQRAGETALDRAGVTGTVRVVRPRNTGADLVE